MRIRGLLVLAITLAGCNDGSLGESPTLTGTIVGVTAPGIVDGIIDHEVIASGGVKSDGAFSITLPGLNPIDRRLVPSSSILFTTPGAVGCEQPVPSDPELRVTAGSLALEGAGPILPDGNGHLIYADRDATVKLSTSCVNGASHWSVTFDCAFRKGWNVLYVDSERDWNDVSPRYESDSFHTAPFGSSNWRQPQ